MILQALKEYYDRKAADAGAKIAPPGWEWKEIPYIVVLSADGKLERLECTYEGNGKARRAKLILVPKSIKRSSGVATNLLWDNPGYALGSGTDKPERLKEQHASFTKAVEALGIQDDEGITALLAFLTDETKLEQFSVEDALWKELQESGANLTFRLAGDGTVIANRPKVKEAIDAISAQSDEGKAVCLVTGEIDSIARKHTSIKGVWGAQSFGASIISFNQSAFESFGKKQGSNAPVGKRAEFAYSTALNQLLDKDSTQRLQVGDASTVFWASRKTAFENEVSAFLSEPPKDNPDRNARAVADLLASVKTGAYALSDKETRFYVLGLSTPDSARIAIRFWHDNTVPEMAARFAQHFQDLEIVRSPRDPAALPLASLLDATAVLRKRKNISPNLAGETMRAILSGTPYPATLLQAAIRRIRADREITYARAALIKATLNRSLRLSSNSQHPTPEKELQPMLDLENQNIGYRLGRLFATLEKIQAEAQKSINATIRDRFYGAASGTPVTVFGTLLRLKNHHLTKLEPGRRVNLERLLCEIMTAIEDFPPHLSLADQGRFAIGYYHQTQDFYTKKSE